MSNITSLPSSYYQLANLSSSTGSSSGSTTDTSTNAASLTQTLISALQGVSDSSSDTSNNSTNSYLLDLSPTAQQLLSGSGSSDSSNGTSSNSTSFTLTSTQKTAITNILEKYKDAPVDQTTFNEIQNDLQAAGLGATQLSAQDQVTSFNATDVFLNALSGNYSTPTTVASATSTEQSKANSYMQSIISQWQSISAAATASSATSSTSSTTSTSITA